MNWQEKAKVAITIEQQLIALNSELIAEITSLEFTIDELKKEAKRWRNKAVQFEP